MPSGEGGLWVVSLNHPHPRQLAFLLLPFGSAPNGPILTSCRTAKRHSSGRITVHAHHSTAMRREDHGDDEVLPIALTQHGGWQAYGRDRTRDEIKEQRDGCRSDIIRSGVWEQRARGPSVRWLSDY